MEKLSDEWFQEEDTKQANAWKGENDPTVKKEDFAGHALKMAVCINEQSAGGIDELDQDVAELVRVDKNEKNMEFFLQGLPLAKNNKNLIVF